MEAPSNNKIIGAANLSCIKNQTEDAIKMHSNHYLSILIYHFHRSSDSLEYGLTVAFRRSPKSDENTVRKVIGS